VKTAKRVRGVVAASAIALSWCLPRPARAKTGPAVPDFSLLDQNGLAHTLYDAWSDHAVVLASFSLDCAGTGAAAARFPPSWLCGQNGVDCFLIDAAASDSRGALAKYAREHGLTVPILQDPAQVVSESLGFRSAGEMLVVKPQNWTGLYRGRADAAALTAVLAGKAPRASRTAGGAGCRIAYAGTRKLTYVSDVAPILIRRCMRCHRAGAAAAFGYVGKAAAEGPPVFTGYRSVRGWRAMMRETLLTHQMPPYYQDPNYGRFSNAPALPPREMRVLVRWLARGEPRGTGPDPLAAVVAPPRADAEPDLVRMMDAPIAVSSAEAGVVHLVMLGGPTSRPLRVRGIRYYVGNPVVVEHLGLKISRTPRPWSEKTIRGDGSSAHPMPASPHFWHLGDPETFMMPEGLAWIVPKGSYLVLSVHYAGDGRAEKDRSGVGLYLDKGRDPVRRLKYAYLIDRKLNIPSDARDYRVKLSRRFDDPVRLYGLGCHAHYRARWTRFTAVYPDGRRETLLSVPWQSLDPMRCDYRLRTPKLIPGGTTIVAEGSFDSSASNPDNPDPREKEVKWGVNLTTDEMFKAFMIYR
jgi:peroxiredoxin